MKQYVGARYVPKFYNNSNSTNDWKNNTSYEALTIVTYNNASYTSKKPVPATVGNPAENTEYWVLTGNYNGQVEQYRQQVVELNQVVSDNYLELKDDVTKTYEKRYIFIGDSYEYNYLGGGWCEGCRDRLRVDYSKIKAMGGASFNGRPNSVTFISLLNDAYNEMNDDEKELITDVVVCGGLNDVANLRDGSYTNAQLISAIALFADHVHELSPNAMVHVGFIGGYNGSGDAFVTQAIKVFRRSGYTHKYLSYIKDAEYYMVYKGLYASDGVHPLDASVSYALGTYIAACLKNCGYTEHALAPTIGTFDANFIRADSSNPWYEILENDSFSIFLVNEWLLNTTPTYTSNIVGRQRYSICHFTNDLLKAHGTTIELLANVQVFGANNELLGNDMCVLYFAGDAVSIVFSNNWSDVTAIAIGRTTTQSFPSIYCCF